MYLQIRMRDLIRFCYFCRFTFRSQKSTPGGATSPGVVGHQIRVDRNSRILFRLGGLVLQGADGSRTFEGLTWIDLSK